MDRARTSTEGMTIEQLGTGLSKDFWLGICAGVLSSALAYLLTRWFLSRFGVSDADNLWSNKAIKRSVLELVGHTPILHLKTLSKVLGNDIYLKMENQNPGRSNKDRAAKHIVQDIIRRQNLMIDTETGKVAVGENKGQKYTVYEGTSGNTGISLGLMCKYYGLNCKVFLNDDLGEEKYSALEASGCTLEKVPNLSYIDHNNFVRKAASSAKTDCSGFFADQFSNPAPREGHYKETGQEILEQLNGKVDVFVMGAGTGATISGISKLLKEKTGQRAKCILADPIGSSLYSWAKFRTLYAPHDREGHRPRTDFRTMVEGIGLNWLSPNLETALVDDGEKVTDEEALNMARYILEHEGLLVGSTTALHVAAAVKHVMRSGCKEKQIVTLACDDGFRHLSKFYSPSKWEKFGFRRHIVDVSNPKDLGFISTTLNNHNAKSN